MKTILIVLLLSAMSIAQSNPQGYWPAEKSQPILDKTGPVRLAPDLSSLTAGEKAAVAKLLEAGKIFQHLYELQRHHQALKAAHDLDQLHLKQGKPQWTENLLTLYRLNQGPIATTLDNKREPFLPVDATVPGKNVYPWGIARDELRAYLAAHSDQERELLDDRSVVRRYPEDFQGDIATLKRFPALQALHPQLTQRLRALELVSANKLYAIPYALAFADQLFRASRLLFEGADALEKDDSEFAIFLRNRARDLITNDYEAGDASWVTGRFKNLNAEIGSYETYDDELLGVKSFFAFSLLKNRTAESAKVRAAIKGLQALHDSLPYKVERAVKEDISVGVYDVIADFGQARGGNTATILPNSALHSQRYGRTILLRANIMQAPELTGSQRDTWTSYMAPEHHADLKPEGGFYRTLWHEIGHYLGVDLDRQGRQLDVALQENADLMEEMKSDLVSLYLAPALHKSGYYTAEQLRAVQASGVYRVVQNVKPRRDQPYQTMMLMQFNYYLQNGLLRFDAATGRLHVDYAKYHDVVSALAKEVLALQHAGDNAAVNAFVEKYTTWDDAVHGRLAAQMRAAQKYRFRLFKYAALGE